MRKSIFRPWNGIPQAPVFWPMGRQPNDSEIGLLQYLYEKRVAKFRIRTDARRKRYAISGAGY